MSRTHEIELLKAKQEESRREGKPRRALHLERRIAELEKELRRYGNWGPIYSPWQRR